jgi:transcriptional regulator with XRE-family HTH domain
MAKPTQLRIQVGHRVRDLRKRQHLSLEALGERSGLNDKFIQAIETGRKAPTVDSLDKLVRGLGIEVRELLLFEDNSLEVMRVRAGVLLSRVPDEELPQVIRILEAALL